MTRTQVPPPSHDTDVETDAGVIDDARKRQRRHRRVGALLLSAVIAAGLILGFAGGGRGDGRGGAKSNAQLGAHGPAARASLLPPELRAQARALYAPVAVYERSTSVAARKRARTGGSEDTRAVNRCDAPYMRTVFANVSVTSKQPAMRQRAKLYLLWDHVALMQGYQADEAPVAAQLTRLAASWKSLSTGNPTIDGFAHAVGTELEDSLSAAPESTCAFMHQAAAHHFSYNWARNSLYGGQAIRWWSVISTAGKNPAVRHFWKEVAPKETLLYSATYRKVIPAGTWHSLFTNKQRSTMVDLPGELG